MIEANSWQSPNKRKRKEKSGLNVLDLPSMKVSQSIFHMKRVKT